MVHSKGKTEKQGTDKKPKENVLHIKRLGDRKIERKLTLGKERPNIISAQRPRTRGTY